jgi:hypothetical protein
MLARPASGKEISSPQSTRSSPAMERHRQRSVDQRAGRRQQSVAGNGVAGNGVAGNGAASGRGATRGGGTVWTVRCQSLPNDCCCSRRGAAPPHVRSAAIGGCTLLNGASAQSKFTTSASGRGAARDDYTVWTARCRSLPMIPAAGAEPLAAAHEYRCTRRPHVLDGASAQSPRLTASASGRGATRGGYTVWTVRC